MSLATTPPPLYEAIGQYLAAAEKISDYSRTVIDGSRRALSAFRDFVALEIGSTDAHDLMARVKLFNEKVEAGNAHPRDKSNWKGYLKQFLHYQDTGTFLYSPYSRPVRRREVPFHDRNQVSRTHRHVNQRNASPSGPRENLDLTFPDDLDRNLKEWMTYLVTFGNYLKDELSSSRHTIKIYRYAVRCFVKFLELKKLNLTPKSVDKSLYLEFQAHAKNTWRLAPSVIVSLYTGNRSFFRFLNSINIVQRSPFEFLRAPKYARGLPRPLTLEQALRLLQAPDAGDPKGLRDLAAMELMLGSGLRISECFGLKRGDLILEGNITGPYLIVRGKGNKERSVPMTTASVNALKKLLPAIGNPDAWIFPSTKKSCEAIHPTTFQARFKFYLTLAQLPRSTTPHVLRHTFATLLLENGADIRIIQEMLGHASLKSTSTYTKVTHRKAHETHKRCHPRNHDESYSKAPALDASGWNRPTQLELAEEVSPEP